MTDMERIVGLLGERTGLKFPEHRRSALDATVRARMEQAGCRTLDELAERLATDRSLFEELVEQVTIGETYFFREPWAFRRLRQHLRSEGSDRGTPLRLWSAACSTGEEAYSLFMTAIDARRGDGLHLVATDISSASLARARAARYGEWSLRGQGRSSALRHLERSGDEWRVVEPMRGRVRFERLNLAADPLPSPAMGLHALDVIFCRNVLVYFDAETVTRVARKLHASLVDGGLLFLAATDPTIDEAAPFERIVTDEGIYYRKSTPPPEARVSPLEPPSPAVHREAETRPSLPAPPPAAARERARAALARGDHVCAEELTRDLLDDGDAAAIHLRASAELHPARAVELAAEISRRHPLSVELHYLRAILLLGAGHLDEAAEAARRVLYLDRSLAAAHLALASILERRGDREGARRAYRNARDLCHGRPADEPLPLTNGEPARHLAAVAAAELARLEST